MPLLLVCLLVLACIVALIDHPFRVERRRERLRAAPFPAAWRRILRQRVPQVGRLPSPLQLELKRQILVFVAEKEFVGCRGFVVDDEVRVTIAAQACLLTLNHPRRDYYPGLRRILVYPGPFIVARHAADAAGVVAEERSVLSGESWSAGRVVLSWPDVVAGAAIDDDGRNVVIHEFAHQLDQEKGYANGAPLLPSRRRYSAWSGVLGAAYARLRDDIDQGRPSLIDAYAATSPAEFFAVVSEVFFEQPERLADSDPGLYAQFRDFYKLDPAHW